MVIQLAYVYANYAQIKIKLYITGNIHINIKLYNLNKVKYFRKKND